MTSSEHSVLNLRPWTWLIGGLVGFLILYGCYPFVDFVHWWDFITTEESHGTQIGFFEVLTWLALGPSEGFCIGFLLAYLFDKCRAKKLVGSSSSSSHE